MFRITGADLTCSPIKYCGFLPLIKDKNKTASACFESWLDDPGKIITGKPVFSEIAFILDSNSLSEI